MWHKYVEPVLQWLYRVIREPRSELNRWQQAVRFSYDLGRYGARQLREDRAPQMAAALSYQAMFALVPVLIVATIIVRAWSAEGFTEFIDSLIATAGLSSFSAPGVGAADNQTLAAWLEEVIGEAAGIDLKAVGWIGFGVIVYASINMLVTIENSFNIIYRAPGGRPWSRRIPLYWFMLTVGPLVLILTAVLNQDVNAWLETLGLGEFLVDAGTKIWSVCVGWLFWFTVYTLVPNTSVNLRSSAIGALVAVILLEFGKSFLGVLIARSLSLNLVIGSLGLIPVFMFWVHLMCLAILFGLELSATLQFLGDHAIKEMESRRESAGLIEPSIVVTAMQVVGQDFESGQPTSQRTIADRVGVSEKLVAPIIQELCRDGYLHRVEGEQKLVCLSRPPDQILAGDLIDVGFRLADSSRESAISAFANRLREAQKERAANVSLDSIIPRGLSGDTASAPA
jgi:membrane protein